MENFYWSVEEMRSQHKHIETCYEDKTKAVWMCMNGSPRPCFSLELLRVMNNFLTDIQTNQGTYANQKIRYVIGASLINGVYNFGGDLELFSELIKNQNRQGLVDYGRACIDVLYKIITHLEKDIDMIALVQGDALGGGFEAVLSATVVVAERGCVMGCPEILFNLFPGMGAFNLLSLKLGPAMARKMILSGDRYLAEDLYDMGIVHILAEKGKGREAVYEYIKRADKLSNGYAGMRRVMDQYNAISHEELMRIVEVWADAALSLSSRDIRLMNRLTDKQIVFNLPN